MILALLLVGVTTAAANAIFTVVANVGVSSSDVGPHAGLATTLAEFVSVLVVTPFNCAVATVLTIDLRVRKEGLDVELLADAVSGRPTGAYGLHARAARGVPSAPWPPQPGLAPPTTPLPAPPTPWPPPPR